MIRDFDITEEKNVGYYAGLITSAFALAQLMTGNAPHDYDAILQIAHHD